MIRVWFNHWFSTVYGLIELIKQDKRERIYVIGSNQVGSSVIRNVCDEWYTEPAISGDEYVDFCLSFCKEHSVDVFIPRRQMVLISRDIERFHELGVRVMVDDYDIISLLNSKTDAYKLMSECRGIKIPPFYKVNDAKAFEDAYRKLREKYDRVCMKFVKDEGGLSFRRITETTKSLHSLKIYQGMETSFDEAYEILSAEGSFDDLMVMPYLAGEEISVDCLDTEDGLIAVPRIKGASRHERVSFDSGILEMTAEILRRVKLDCPCNVQFKLMDDIPYFLEVNTRMSGGLQMSCLAADVNIPNIALNKLLGRRVEWTLDNTDKTVSYIERPETVPHLPIKI